MNEDTPAFRDRIVAVLSHRGPLSIKEICALLHDDPQWTYRHHMRVYSNLRALASAGRVVWHSWGTLERQRTDGLPVPPARGAYFEVPAEPLPVLDDEESVERWLAE